MGVAGAQHGENIPLPLVAPQPPPNLALDTAQASLPPAPVQVRVRL